MTEFSHPSSLSGKAVVVTGAARGVGRGIAVAMLSRGASVLAVDVDAAGLAATAQALDGIIVPLVADLRDPDTPARVVDAAVRDLGGIDGLVNNAVATNEPKPLVNVTADDYDLVFDTAPRATFFMMQAVHPVMVAAGGGAIVNLGSASGTGGQSKFAAYAGAKEAVRGMSKAAALEWGRDGIRVNVVCPFADSEGVRLWQTLAPKDFERAVRSVPLRRVGRTAEDVGSVVAFLVSDDADYVTAQTIHVDGGAGVHR